MIEPTKILLFHFIIKSNYNLYRRECSSLREKWNADDADLDGFSPIFIKNLLLFWDVIICVK